MTEMSSRELNQDLARAKRAAEEGPVVITRRGRPAHVLLSYRTYERLVAKGGSLADLLDDRSGAGAELPIERPRTSTLRVPDLTD